MPRTEILVCTVLLAACCSGARAQQPLTADQIMARVAANQDRAEQQRSQYVYKQHIHVVSRKTNGKLMREETADYDVFPSAQKSEKKLKQLAGKYWFKGHYLTYSGDEEPDSGSLDANLVHVFRTDLVSEKSSKDGFASDLFPLRTEKQKEYKFVLRGEETLNGRRVYHISFQPGDNSDYDWKGEAFIDEQDFEPINVYTKLSKRIPFVVRTMLGTSLPGIGFSVTYKREPDGVWFPSSLGTEFRMHVLFFFNRNFSISLTNSGFEHTHVESKIVAVSAPK